MFEVGKKYKSNWTAEELLCLAIGKECAVLEFPAGSIIAASKDCTGYIEVKPLFLKELKPGEKFKFIAWPHSDMVPCEKNSIFIRSQNYGDYVSIMSTFSWRVWTNGNYLNKEVIRVT